MMKNRMFQRFLSMLLMVLMVLATAAPSIGAIEIGTGSESTFQSALQAATQAETEKTPIDAAIFFSDLHTHSTNMTNADYKSKLTIVNGVFGSLKNTNYPFSSVTSCGDAFAVNNDTDSGDFKKFTGKTSVISGWIRNALGNTALPVNYVWSDHDRYAVLEDDTTALSKDSGFIYGAGADKTLGTDDDANYYIFSLSMADIGTNDRYSAGFHSNTEIAAAIEAFTADAQNLHQDRPLFIASHQPLYYKSTRNDNANAYQWYTAISEVADNMDVVFLHGHNHKYDVEGDYCFNVGEKMDVCSGNYKSTEVTLNFTHINTGYLAPESSTSYSDTTRLNVAVAAVIYEDSISLTTYGKSGKYTGDYALDISVTRAHAAKDDTTDDSETDTPVTNEPIVDANTNISVKAENASGLTVSVVTDEKYSNAVSEIFSGSVVMYDIKLDSFEGEVSVTIPIPAGMDASKFCVYHVAEDGTTEPMSGKPAADGMTYTFTTNHFSVFVGGVKKDVSIGGEVVTGTAGKMPTTNVTYKLTNTIISGRKYLIASGSSGNVHFLLYDGKTPNNNTNVDKIANLSNLNNYLWTIEGNATDGYTIQAQNGTYMYPNAEYSSSWLNIGWSYKISSQQGSSQNVRITFNGNAASISRSVSSNITSYLTYNSNFSAASRVENGVYLFEQVPASTGATVTINAEKPDVLTTGTSVDLVYEITLSDKTVVTSANITWESNSLVSVSNGKIVAGNTTGTTTLKGTLNSVNGTTLSEKAVIEIPVTVKAPVAVEDIDVENFTVNAGTSLDERMVAVIVTYEDKTTKTVMLPLSALKDENGNTVDTNVSNTKVYENLTVTYEGQTETGIKLTVFVDNFPQYPMPGSVNLNKTAIGIDFQNTGVSKIELSASGLPAGGVDVVVVVDTGSSMSGTRLDAAKTAISSMLTLFMNAHDTYGSDIDLSVVGFNGFAGSDFEYIQGASLTNAGRTTGDSALSYTTTNGPGTKDVYDARGNFQLGAENFMNNSKLTQSNIATLVNYISAGSGTNYDGGLASAYRLLAAKKAANATPRKQFVVFMSDGAGFLYNGFMAPNSSSNGGRTMFNRWLTGEWESVDALKAAINNNQFPNGNKTNLLKFAEFYNGNGETHPNRIAEAIKGTPGQEYTIVRSGAGAANNYMEQWDGLGATIYSIGLEMADDGSGSDGTVTKDTLYEVINVISSGANYGFPDATNEQLQGVFSKIAAEINIAATNARFVDQLGDSFELQMNPTIKTNAIEGTRTINTDITVTTRPVYTYQDYVDKNCSVDDIGKPYGDGTTYETVKFVEFNANGTIKTVNSTAKDGNILDENGVICAKYFFYNTTKFTQTITLENGSTYDLPAETFYWNIGTINEQQFTLTYYVYLTGALDGGGVPSGGYSTNNFAILTYDNYLGNEVSMSVASPSIAWKGAQVSYAFYLVDTSGRPVYKDGSLAPNFYTAYKVTQPVVYSTIELNDKENTSQLVGSILGKNVLPEGYQLYGAAASVSYSVSVASGDALGQYYSSWTITGGGGATYVTGFGANAEDYSREEKVTTDPTPADGAVSHVDYDFTHTTVWFPVVWIPTTIPDKVVIDYGLPLYISIMDNDQFGASATLVGIETIENTLNILNNKLQGQTQSATVANLNTFNFPTKLYANKSTPTSLNLTYGAAAVEGQKILYTPMSTSMDGYERFAYEIRYYTSDNVEQYYYGTVTVIPATTVYYEDNFEKDTQTGITYTGTWEVIDNTDSKQDEDRPGQFSLPNIDANNLYGYDAAYKGMASYSMNGYHMASVTSGQFASVSFNFVGTGFDIISMTGGQTGGILVDIVNPTTGAIVQSLMVDTYYGYTYGMSKVTYTYTNGKWEETSVVLASAGTSAGKPTKPQNGDTYVVYENRWVQTDEGELYQVPVIKASGLEHGAYRVDIYVFYDELFAAKNTQEFYLDAIRIYNPAGDTYGNSGNIDSVIQDAYFADGEAWPVYHELRNLVLDSGSIGSNYASGLVFIDGYGNTADISNYRNFGPNNELYLAPGQSISGVLNCDDANVEKIQIALKTVGGTGSDKITGSVKIYDANLVDNADEVAARTIDSATDLYYEITALNGKNIVIHNSSAADSGVIISITNIKVTHEAKPAASGSTTFAEEPATSLFLVNDESAARALFTLRAPIQPDLFEPDHFGIRIPAPTVKLGQKVTVIITTSKDVEALMVNGKLVSKYTGNKKSLFRTWSVQVRAEEVGDMKVSVIALDSNGLESASISDTVTVVAKQNKK